MRERYWKGLPDAVARSLPLPPLDTHPHPRAIQLIQEDGRLWNALQQMTAEGMYASTSPTYATCNKLLAAIGAAWRLSLA